MRLIDADALQLAIVEEGQANKRKKYIIGDIWELTGAEIREVINSQPTIQPEPHWIPVTENTLPDINRVVVVCGEKGTWDYGTYRGHGDNIHFWHWKKNTYKRVYWWMYKEDALPEPYKGVTDGRD